MPLPDNVDLKLFGQSTAPGTVQAKRKHAIIFRLSAETLRALENAGAAAPKVEIDFGDKPGFYINDSFYSVRQQQENSPHEIYLRTTQPGRPSNQLKLYAGVTGKFTVQEQLEQITERIKVKGKEAAQQRTQRKTIVIDTPPPQSKPSAGAKKKKTAASSSMFRKPVAQAGHTLNASTSSTSAPAARVASPAPGPKKMKDSLIDARKRMIHCLAVSDRPADEVIKMVGGNTADSDTKQDLRDLLAEIAEEIPMTEGEKKGKSPRNWSLKQKSWLEVRPYEWPRLSDHERTTMARQARHALKALKIPEHDDRWEHARYRPPASLSTQTSTSGVATSSVADAAKRTASGSAAKERKPRTGLNGEKPMKDESVRPVKPNGKGIAVDEAERRPSPATATASAAARRLPGSRNMREAESPNPPLRKQAAVVSSNSRGTPVSSIPQKSSPSGLAQREELPRAAGGRSVPGKIKKKKKEESDREDLSAAAGGSSISGRTKKMKEEESDRDWTAKERQRDTERRALVDQRAASGTKRKKPAHEDEDGEIEEPPLRAVVQKRRKTDADPPGTSRMDHPSLPPKPKASRDASPQLRSRESKATPTPPLGKPAAARGGSATKRRRDLITYTSSEDEGEIPQPPAKRAQPRLPPSLPTPPSARDSRTQHLASGTSKGNGLRPQTRPFSRPLPKDRHSLRRLYSATYQEHLRIMLTICEQRDLAENMLMDVDRAGSDGSVTDYSDGEAELLEPDSLRMLSERHAELHNELHAIREAYDEAA